MTYKSVVSVQLIKIQWDKTHRGPKHGAIRKALPRFMPFDPPPHPPEDRWHQVVFNALDGYKEHESWRSKRKGIGNERRNAYPASVKPEGEFLRVGLGRDLHLGKMRKRLVGRTFARLPFGKRVAIHFNDAHDGYHQRLYSEYALHVGYADRPTLDLPLFREIDLRRLLY